MLSTQQLQLIKETIPVLRANGTALTRYFYERMLRLNPELKAVFNMGHQRTGDQAKALASAVLAYAENIENLAVLGDAVNQIVTKHVSLNIQPEQYSIVGDNLLNSISEVLTVPMESELIKAWEVAYTQLANILIAGEKAAYEALEAQESGWRDWREFAVVKKVKESDEITSFYLQPTDQQPILSYQPGQYISLRVNVPELGFKQPRQYTLSHHGLDGLYRISVKREDVKGDLASGYVSQVLHHDIEVGSSVELSAPNGVFFLQNPERPHVFISAGIGITPMMAMLGKLSELRSSQKISFLHACRNHQVLAFSEEIMGYQAHLPQLELYLACEQTGDLPAHSDKIGRLDLTEVDAKLLPKDADYYLCGPDQFMEIQAASLEKLGIAAAQIYSERFNTGDL